MTDDLLKEALDMLEKREITTTGGCCGEDECNDCQITYRYEDVERNGIIRQELVTRHEDTCAWLALMKKAGRR